MKLDSIKSCKFEKFKGNVVLKRALISGGTRLPTRRPCKTNSSDCWDNSIGNDINCTDGSNYDFCK